MKSRNKRTGMRSDQGNDNTKTNTRNNIKNNTKRKVLVLLLLAFIFFVFCAVVVEAGPMDSIKNAWSKMRVFALSGAFWINALIIFGIAFLLYTLLLSKTIGSDKAQQGIMYTVLIIVALIVATKFVGANDAPQYLWHNDQFRDFTQFIIGPSAKNQLGSCAAPTHSFWKALTGINPNPPCCGTGAYFTTARGDRVCKQAILRTNSNGSGLPALIISFILLYILFNAYGAKLGFDRMGSGGGRWFPIILSLVLAALLTNERITKNNIIMIGGWVAVVLLGSALSKSLSGEKDPTGSKKGFGFGLAFALIQLIANMLGTSLFGGTYAAADIGLPRILWNLAIGFGIGFLYSAIAGGGIFGKMGKNLKTDQKDDIDDYMYKGKYWKAFKRSLPIIGRLWGIKKQAQDKKKKDEKISRELNRVWNAYLHAMEKTPYDKARQAQLLAMAQKLEGELMKEKNKTNDDINNLLSTAGSAGPGAPQREGGTGPPRIPI